jgi:2',3'-cyclic-nucleotide 2'-phosphodiesterase (5'-nucleotidase family)
VTYANLQGLFPFDNELVLCSIKGRDLIEKFLETDNRNYFVSYGDYGEQIKDNIDPDGTYYVVVDSYTSTYAPNNLTEIERYGAPVYARDLLANYIMMGGLG